MAEHIIVNRPVHFLHVCSVAIDVQMQFLPDPRFGFCLELDFDESFRFMLNVEMEGDVNSAGTNNLNFTALALFEQNILEYVADKWTRSVDKASEAVADGFEDARREVAEEEKAFKEDVRDAKEAVEEARVA